MTEAPGPALGCVEAGADNAARTGAAADIDAEDHDEQHRADGPPRDCLLRIDRVSARYHPVRGGGLARPRTDAPLALEQVSLDVDAGEIAAVLGPNGAGKSTLLRLAAGLLEPSQGEVWVSGRKVRDTGRRQLARMVALLPQSEGVALGFRVRDVVAMGRAPHQGTWLQERPEDRDIVEDAIARCDLSDLAERRVDELSGGERRRVALARALAQRPRVLLLDEPSAFLDVRHRLELHDLLVRVVGRERIACVAAMHELEAAAHLASRVLLLRAGRVVAVGAPDEVMTPSRLAEAFDVRVEVTVHAPDGRRIFVVTTLDAPGSRAPRRP